jgi:hypothetical protein
VVVQNVTFRIKNVEGKIEIHTHTHTHTRLSAKRNNGNLNQKLIKTITYKGLREQERRDMDGNEQSLNIICHVA